MFAKALLVQFQSRPHRTRRHTLGAPIFARIKEHTTDILMHWENILKLGEIYSIGWFSWEHSDLWSMRVVLYFVDARSQKQKCFI